MTDKQKHKYFREWRDACLSNGWRTEKGKAVQDAHNQGRAPNDWAVKVWTFAEQIAKGEYRAVTMDDLRHGAHVVALGRDKSSSTLTNAELDRVFLVLRLLTDPDDIDAQMAWDGNGENGERRRQVWFIKRSAPHAYIDAICRDKFGGIYVAPFWEDLPLWALRELSRTLANRRKTFSQKATKEAKGEIANSQSPIANGAEAIDKELIPF